METSENQLKGKSKQSELTERDTPRIFLSSKAFRDDLMLLLKNFLKNLRASFFEKSAYGYFFLRIF